MHTHIHDAPHPQPGIITPVCLILLLQDAPIIGRLMQSHSLHADFNSLASTPDTVWAHELYGIQLFEYEVTGEMKDDLGYVVSSHQSQ
jgi:hypothetical protein